METSGRYEWKEEKRESEKLVNNCSGGKGRYACRNEGSKGDLSASFLNRVGYAGHVRFFFFTLCWSCSNF